MAFVATKLLRLGLSQAKKHKAKSEQEHFQQAPPPGYPYQYPPQPYAMTEYLPGLTPGSTAMASAAGPAAPAKKVGSKVGSMFLSAFRFLQFVMGMTVIGLYGRDVQHDHEVNHTWNPKWVYAVGTAFLATMTAAMHMLLPCCLRRFKKTVTTNNGGLYLPQFVWEFILCILWLTLFGIFGKMYIGVNPSSASTSPSNPSLLFSVNATAPAVPATPSSTSSSGHSRRDTVSALGDPAKITRMRHALWVDLVNLGFWAITASWVLLRWMRCRRAAGNGAARRQDGDVEK